MKQIWRLNKYIFKIKLIQKIEKKIIISVILTGNRLCILIKII